MMMQGTVEFRIIHDTDRAFLERLYAASRDWEMQHVNMDEAAKATFLKQQFEAQDRAYKSTYLAAVHRIIQLDGTDIGRLIVDRQDDCLRIIDLSILPEYRGRGIGTDILRSLMNEAHGGKVPVRLHTRQNSPALRLYLRHGFRATEEVGAYYALEWMPDLRPAEL